MTPLAWSIAANTGGTVLAIVLAALAFLRADRHMRHARTVVQAHARCGAQPRTLSEVQPDEYVATTAEIRPVRFESPETPAERTQPHGDLPLLCGDDRPVSGRHALTDDTRHMPHVGDLPTGGEVR